VPSRFFIFLCLFLITLSIPFNGIASIMVTPYRAVFEDRTRSQVITIINRSDKVATFRTEWFNTIVDENGSYEIIEENDPRYASIKTSQDFIRFSPRQVTLAPGDKQAIRIAVRKPAGLEDGEYRSHLLFKQLSDPKDYQDNPAGISLSLNLSISIPVILRQGNLEVNAEITAVDYKKSIASDQQDQFIVSISRTGDASTYGSLKVFDANDTSNENLLAVVNNVSIFPETAQKNVSIPIYEDIPSSIKKLRVIYEGKNEYNNRIFHEFTFNRP